MATSKNAVIQRDIAVLADKKILAYPTTLGFNEKDNYGQDEQYVMIRINTDTKSTKLRTINRATGQYTIDRATGNTVVTNGRTGVGIATEPFSTAQNTDQATRIKYGEEALKNEKWLTQKGMVSLDRVIILPMPNEHSSRTSIAYNAEYEPTQLTRAGDMLNQGLSGIASGLWTKAKNNLISGLVNRVKSGATNRQALEAEERLSENPKKEVMFDSFGFRKFSFNYMFAPKNEFESDTVEDIIETLRYYALPEITKGKMYYIFPSEFEISFMLGQKENTHIHRIATCVLQNVNVNYTPNSLWSSLPNGAPLAVSVTLDFLELEMIDRSRVYNPKSKITSGY